jgi:splicing factor 3A subunit 1
LYPLSDAAPAVQQPPVALPAPGNVDVRKYDPKASKASKNITDVEQYLVSPITGEKVLASKVQEHMRIGLLDPRWVEERDKQITARAVEDQVYAPGQAIENSLKHLAERRTDIFGVGEEAAQEAAIGKKMGEEEKRQEADKVTWDGHSSSAEAAARAARANISLNDQIEQIHRNKGLISDNMKESIGPRSTGGGPPVQVMQQHIQQPPQQQVPVVNLMPMRPQMVVPAQQFYMAPQPQMAPTFMLPPMPPQQQQQQQPQEMEEEPPNKRARGEDNLMPEADFLARNVSPVTFRVVVPSSNEKPEWQLNGQMLSVTLPLSDPMSALKAKLYEETGMPPGKQKLQMENIFFKDTNTLGYYNIYPNTVVHLQIKERGGRKK